MCVVSCLYCIMHAKIPAKILTLFRLWLAKTIVVGCTLMLMCERGQFIQYR